MSDPPDFPDGYPSKSRLDKLGRKLADEGLSDQEADELAIARAHWGDALDALTARVNVVVEPHGSIATGRLKNLGTIAEKIRRDRTNLSRMRDVVGCRVTSPNLYRPGQAEIVELLRAEFERYGDVRVIDRVADPRFGYRAVHLEVSVFGVQAEIQVRTGLQHLWAESMERLADRFGRGLRYGDRSVLDNLDAGLRAEVVDLLQILERMSEQVNQFESVAASWPTGSRDHAAGVRLHTARTTLEDVFVEFRAALDDVG